MIDSGRGVVANAETGGASTSAIRVSILINNYNYAEFVGVAVESALAQTYAVTEVIVVDDGSTDHSLAVLQAYGSRITLVAKANGGQGSAYNAGFACCVGDLVIFLDADDWLNADAVAQVVSRWRPGIAKIQFPLTLVDHLGHSLHRQVPRSMSDTTAPDLVSRFGTYGSPPGSGNAYDAAFLRNILPMNEAHWRIAADTVPILLAPVHGEVLTIENALGAYRQHRSANDTSLMTNNATKNLWDEYVRIDQSKRFVKREFAKLGRVGEGRLMLAPWEARAAILSVRFGGKAPTQIKDSNAAIVWLAFYSLWRWPHWSSRLKTLQSVWMIALLGLPTSLARRIASKHKAAAGLPVPAPHGETG